MRRSRLPSRSRLSASRLSRALIALALLSATLLLPAWAPAPSAGAPADESSAAESSAAHRLRVVIAGADAGNFARYPLDVSEPTIEVQRNARHPSRIVLPVREVP